MKDQQEPIKVTQECCDALLMMKIQWMLMGDKAVMPFIKGSDNKSYRVNHCPSCGKYIRDIELNLEKISNL